MSLDAISAPTPNQSILGEPVQSCQRGERRSTRLCCLSASATFLGRAQLDTAIRPAFSRGPCALTVARSPKSPWHKHAIPLVLG